eukprot:2333728-Rhodomonas_salina.3
MCGTDRPQPPIRPYALWRCVSPIREARFFGTVGCDSHTRRAVVRREWWGRAGGGAEAGAPAGQAAHRTGARCRAGPYYPPTRCPLPT